MWLGMSGIEEYFLHIQHEEVLFKEAYKNYT